MKKKIRSFMIRHLPDGEDIVLFLQQIFIYTLAIIGACAVILLFAAALLILANAVMALYKLLMFIISL